MRLNNSILLAALAIGLSFALAGHAPGDDELKAEDNPYLAGAKLTRAELDEFLKSMERKPQSVRKRAGFNEALVDAADRILAGGNQDELAGRALVFKLQALHFLADSGSEKADKQLATVAAEHVKDERADVAEAARFYTLERQALDADALEPADLPPLLEQLKKYCANHELDARHLRMASATVRIINRLPDAAAAKTAYAEFGGYFAKSEDLELSRYGRKIERGPKTKPQPAEEPPAAAP